MSSEFENKRVVVTCADVFMGDIVARHFETMGANVLADKQPLTDEAQVDALLAEAGDTDILVINLDEPAHSALADEIKDDDWFMLADKLVHPLMRVTRAFLPHMKARKAGKIIAINSSAPLRGLPKNASYCAMRGAQNAFIQAVGKEVARDNIQVNAVAQNYVENETYYPAAHIQTERFQAHLKANVPSQSVAPEAETAHLVAFLASQHNTHIVGRIIQLDGGWS